jgi:hypothetical protein
MSRNGKGDGRREWAAKMPRRQGAGEKFHRLICFSWRLGGGFFLLFDGFQQIPNAVNSVEEIGLFGIGLIQSRQRNRASGV